MHAAVWSQPIVNHKLRRCQSRAETPQTTSGKTVLGAGIALTLLGGLLAVLGLTGYFMWGDTRYYIGFGSLAGVFSVLTGLMGIRLAGRLNATKRQYDVYVLMSILTCVTSLAMATLGTYILCRRGLVYMTSVIAVSETSIAFLVAILTSVSAGAGIYSRQSLTDSCPRPSDLSSRPSDPVTRYRPSLLASETTSPDTTASPVSEPEG